MYLFSVFTVISGVFSRPGQISYCVTGAHGAAAAAQLDSVESLQRGGERVALQFRGYF